MKLLATLCTAALLSAAPRAAEQVKYENNFEKAEAGSVPDEFLVLDGAFEVKAQEGNKVLYLPGTPLDSFGVLFGVNEKENVAVSARIFGTKKGRRLPTFAVGLDGVGGYKLRVSPGKQQVEIYRGDAVKASVPFEWESGKWTLLKLSVEKTAASQWVVEGKVWQEGGSEPSEPTIKLEDTEAPPSGKQMVSASPYATTPILFDDFRVTTISK
jgi:hypothetical protein